MAACFICKRRNANFQFPREPNKHQTWINGLGISELNPPWPYDKICFAHFPSSQLKTTDKGHWRLLPGAVPCDQEAQSATCERVSVIHRVSGRKDVQGEAEGSTQDEILSTVILIAGTLFLVFIPFLLFFLSSSKGSVKETKDVQEKPPTPQRVTPVDAILMSLKTNYPRKNIKKKF